MAVKINMKQYSLFPALFGFGPEVAVSAFPALCSPHGVCGVAVHAYSFVKEPVLSLFETCHSKFL